MGERGRGRSRSVIRKTAREFNEEAAGAKRKRVIKKVI